MSFDELADINKKALFVSFLNKILQNIQGINYVAINDPAEFKDIDRLLITKQENTQIITDMMEDFLKFYNKNELSFYDRHRLKAYIMTFIKNLCASTNHAFVKKRQDKTIYIDGVGHRRTYQYYSIINKIE